MIDLYENFYKLTADPFRLGPDHRFVLDHRSYAKSKSYLEYALQRGEGFIVITGAAGTGKTTLISDILEQLDKMHIQVATLNSTQLESRDMLHMVAASFDLPLNEKEMDKPGLLLALEEFLKQQGKKGRRAVLIVDEAQGLSSSALEELRLLANLQLKSRLLLQVFLVGQESLRELIGVPEMDHLRQRIVAASHIDALELGETVDYIEYRLSRVGWKGDPSIDVEALTLIHSFSGGIPRRINLICSRLFLYGAMEKKHELVGDDARSVIEDLRREHLMAPAAEQVNGTTGVPSSVEAEREEQVVTPIHSLPREKKTVEDPALSDQARSAEVHSKTTTESGPESPPYAENDIWNEIEALKQQLINSSQEFEQSETLDDGAIEAARDDDRPAGTAKPASVDRRVVTEPHYTPRPRAERERPRTKSTTTMVVIGLLAAAAVVVAMIGGDDNVDIATDAGIPESQGTAIIRGGVSEPPQETTVGDAVASNPQPAGNDEGRSPSESPLASGGASPPVAVQERGPVSELSAEAGALITQSSDVVPPRTAAVPTTAEVPDPKVVGSVEEETEQKTLYAIRAEQERLRAEAKKRLDQRLVAAPPPAPVTARPAVPAPAKPAPVGIQPSRPKIPAGDNVPARVAVATIPQRKPDPALNGLDRLRTALMAGGWTSTGKPAALLPSEITSCIQEEMRITCRSVPQNVETSYGLAIYKVEAKLQSFSASGEFRLYYQTLVRLVGGSFPKLENTASTGSGAWQVTDHSMTCQLTQLSKILCRDDEKGAKREYRRL